MQDAEDRYFIGARSIEKQIGIANKWKAADARALLEFLGKVRESR
jgi:hypothetical protein